MTTSTTTIDTMRRVAETLGLNPGSQFASGDIGRTLTGDITLSPRVIDLLLDLATGGAAMPKGSTFITEEEIPEVLGALEIAAQVHVTCGNAIQSANYQAVYSDIANRETA
jgi:hypothetical protein